MAFSEAAFWSSVYLKEGSCEWHCSYEGLRPLVLPAVHGKPRASALIIGSGISHFPEQLYDSGVRDIVVVDACTAAVEEVKKRNEQGRSGLKAFVVDIGAVGGPSPPSCSPPRTESPQPPASVRSASVRASGSSGLLKGPGASGSSRNSTLCCALGNHALFDLVLDKGTLDCVLSATGSWGRAVHAMEAIHAAMRTPGVFVMVSHSPPDERRELVESVYWHEVKVKQVTTTDVERLSSVPYEEVMRDVALTWGHPPQPTASPPASSAPLFRTEGGLGPSRAGSMVNSRAASKQAPTKADGTPALEAAHAALPAGVTPLSANSHGSAPLPEEQAIFQPGQAFIYIMTK